MKKIQSIIAVLIVSVLAAVTLTACADDSKKATEGLEYKAMEDGTYAVTGYTGDAVDVYIPAEYNDVKVTIIDEEAFKETEIQSISGGENIVEVGSEAFASCYMLKSFDLEGDITEIDWDAFSECKSLKSVKLPDTLTEIKSNTFEGCHSLQSVTLPKTLTKISDEAFKDCESLNEINLPESLEKIGYSAFMDCNSLQSITIPANVKSVGEYAFASNDRKITVTLEGPTDEWNKNWYMRKDGRKCAKIVYNNGETGIPDVTVKFGTYEGSPNIYIDSEGVTLYSNDGSVEKYTYEIEEDCIYCTSTQNNSTMTLSYNEKWESISMLDKNGYFSRPFQWISAEKPTFKD